MDRLYLHSDGAKMYKCYNIVGLIIRISCLVHMRRPFFKLKDVSQDAMEIVKLADKIFHLDKKIKEGYKGDADRITQERVLQIGPVLHTIKNILDLLMESYNIIKSVSNNNTQQAGTRAWALKDYDLSTILQSEFESESPLFEFWRKVNTYEKIIK